MTNETALAARLGDQEAFCRLVGTFWPRLVGIARAIVGEADAEDVTQEALVDAWQGIEALDQPEAIGGWLRRIVVRRSVRHARRRRLRELVWRPTRVVEHDPTDHLEAERLLAALPPRQRAVMVLTAVEGATDTEIAEELGISAAGVRSHRRRARATIDRIRGGTRDA